MSPVSGPSRSPRERRVRSTVAASSPRVLRARGCRAVEAPMRTSTASTWRSSSRNCRCNTSTRGDIRPALALAVTSTVRAHRPSSHGAGPLTSRWRRGPTPGNPPCFLWRKTGSGVMLGGAARRSATDVMQSSSSPRAGSGQDQVSTGWWRRGLGPRGGPCPAPSACAPLALFPPVGPAQLEQEGAPDAHGVLVLLLCCRPFRASRVGLILLSPFFLGELGLQPGARRRFFEAALMVPTLDHLDSDLIRVPCRRRPP